MEESSNRIYLAGEICEGPAHSHTCRGEDFFMLKLAVRRLSGTADLLPVVLPARAVPPGARPGVPLWVRGQVRAYMQEEAGRPHLQLSVFARRAGTDVFAHENDVQLTGYLCKPPVLRVTPMGRTLTDLFLACNRAFGRADYLPVITWSENARLSAQRNVGELLRVSGRLQSRVYEKQLESGETLVRTVCEISGAAQLVRPCTGGDSG